MHLLGGLFDPHGKVRTARRALASGQAVEVGNLGFCVCGEGFTLLVGQGPEQGKQWCLGDIFAHLLILRVCANSAQAKRAFFRAIVLTAIAFCLANAYI